MPRIADRIAERRRSGFIGREAPIRVFTDLLGATSPSDAVLFVHGPAGIGKSTLLRRFGEMATERRVPTVAVDGRDVPPTAEALRAVLDPLLGDNGSAVRTAVLLDSYELFAPADDAFRADIAPELPADTLLVIAARQPPTTGWRTDPGWSDLLRVVSLANLSSAEAHAYLTGRDVPAAAQETAVRFTGGHPLALALIAQVLRNRGSFTPNEAGDVIAELMDLLISDAPTREHRRAMEAAGQVRVVTEPLLAALLDIPDAGELFGWLRTQPFVDQGPFGLHLQELARNVLASDLRWRHPDRYGTLHSRARTFYLDRLTSGGAANQAAVLMDLMFLHPDLRPFLRPPDSGTQAGRVERFRAADQAEIAAMLEHWEGAESAALARFWMRRQPSAWLVVRSPDDAVLGALCLLAVQDLDPEDHEADPAIIATRRELGNHPPLRPGERVTIVRFWLSARDYQSVSAVQSLITTQLARHYLTTPGLAVSLVPFAHPQEWAEACAYTDQRRAPDADFTVGERTYAVFQHDWRLVPPTAWVALLSAREIGETPELTEPGPADAVLVLDEKEFAAGVKAALRFVTRPDRLRDNPLLRSRLVTAHTGPSAADQQRVQALQEILVEAARLTGTPADRRLARVLHRAYIAPAASLEKAAEVLDLPPAPSADCYRPASLGSPNCCGTANSKPDSHQPPRNPNVREVRSIVPAGGCRATR